MSRILLYLFFFFCLVEERCTVYFSTSLVLSNEDDLQRILDHSRRNNEQAGITGILLYVRGSIIQVLEGEAQAVESLFKRIQLDNRHTNVTRVLNRSITQRLFPGWSMGYELITHQQLDAVKALLQLDPSHGAEGGVQPNDHLIVRMLRSFYETNRHN